MKIGPKDWLFIALIGAVLAIVLLISGRKRQKRFPLTPPTVPPMKPSEKQAAKVRRKKAVKAVTTKPLIPCHRVTLPKIAVCSAIR